MRPYAAISLLLALASVRAGAAEAARRAGPPDELAARAGAYRAGQRVLAVAPFRAGDGWTLLLADAQTDRLRLLFPAEGGEGYVAGAELARPEPAEWRVRFDADASGHATALRATRVDAPEAWLARRVPVRSVEIRFSRDGVRFEGTLHLPPGGGRAPAVVLAHGSEDSDRYSFGPVPWVLAANGYAVLAWDKRGTGRSGGDWRPAGVDVLAADLAAAVEHVAARREVDPERIAVLGMSEGAWVAPFAAARSPRIRAIAAICGGARTKGDAYVHKVRREREAAGDRGATLEAAVRAAEAEIAESRARVRERRDVRGFDLRVTYDPTAHWRRFQGPVLYMGGEADVLESAPEAAAWLERLFAEAGHADVTIRVWPRAHHSLLLGVTGDPAEFRTLHGIGQLAPGYWDVLLRWLGTRVASR